MKDIIFLIGSTNSGKTTVAKYFTDRMHFSETENGKGKCDIKPVLLKEYTTRERRDGESDDMNYFVSEQELDNLIETREMIVSKFEMVNSKGENSTVRYAFDLSELNTLLYNNDINACRKPIVLAGDEYLLFDLALAIIDSKVDVDNFRTIYLSLSIDEAYDRGIKRITESDYSDEEKLFRIKELNRRIKDDNSFSKFIRRNSINYLSELCSKIHYVLNDTSKNIMSDNIYNYLYELLKDEVKKKDDTSSCN